MSSPCGRADDVMVMSSRGWRYGRGVVWMATWSCDRVDGHMIVIWSCGSSHHRVIAWMATWSCRQVDGDMVVGLCGWRHGRVTA